MFNLYILSLQVDPLKGHQRGSLQVDPLKEALSPLVKRSFSVSGANTPESKNWALAEEILLEAEMSGYEFKKPRLHK